MPNCIVPLRVGGTNKRHPEKVPMTQVYNPNNKRAVRIYKRLILSSLTSAALCRALPLEGAGTPPPGASTGAPASSSSGGMLSCSSLDLRTSIWWLQCAFCAFKCLFCSSSSRSLLVTQSLMRAALASTCFASARRSWRWKISI